MLGSHPHHAKADRPRWLQRPLSASGRADFPIVAIGASAGGLVACRKLLDALPAHNGMAFIIVQHLDPSHDSMMVDLLAGHTPMPVLMATDGMKIERERVYVIPPGVYLSADEKGALRLSKPQARHGARLPFDILLNSLAREHGARTVCVVLSGTGSDGSLGLRAVSGGGGLVIAQDISEADYDGMPHSAIATGAVDLVARTAKIAEALVARERGHVLVPERPKSSAQRPVEDLLPDIIALLRTKTVHDFAFYKHGTLERRVERRIALAGVKTAPKVSRPLASRRQRTRSALQGLADQCHRLL
jgi:two-component system CheB/CheR fusion protein